MAQKAEVFPEQLDNLVLSPDHKVEGEQTQASHTPPTPVHSHSNMHGNKRGREEVTFLTHISQQHPQAPLGSKRNDSVYAVRFRQQLLLTGFSGY